MQQHVCSDEWQPVRCLLHAGVAAESSLEAAWLAANNATALLGMGSPAPSQDHNTRLTAFSMLSVAFAATFCSDQWQPVRYSLGAEVAVGLSFEAA